METVILGLGANLGDPARQIAEAVEALRAWVRIERVSSLYRTEPVGFRDQPDFHNAVAVGTTALAPEELLRAVLSVEEAMGRRRSFRDAPRAVDIDLLDHGGRVMEAPGLTLPHPRLHERAFVLVPLAEAAPEWRHPVHLRTARELLSTAGARERVERVGALSVSGAGGP
ncbi:MAG TPA: 2-amino-4-hydroxy-6-hydroxymethyldihydropteridine diphosphokinase [Longimicrobium sp.]|nr:2-amino-4-hydroxy-6-hydroxymethyldihydropteridine diphosphokinase [Longimicrobium sp.]